MKNFKIFSLFTLLALSSCNIDPEYYSEIAPSTFYDSPGRVYQRLASPYIHVSYNEGMGFNMSPWAMLQEFTTDEVSMPVRGGDWYDGGYYLRPQKHDFTPTTAAVNSAWQAVGSGVSKALDVKGDLEKFVDFEKMFPEDPQGTKENIFAQLDVLMASCYLRGLDLFGGCTIYTSIDEKELKPRSTDKELFDHIEKLLKTSLPKLPKKSSLTAIQTGNVDQGVAASLLARLYFNAESYIGVNMFDECATLCQDIIDNKYGTYELANSFQEIFGWGNETCGEIIWTVPSDNAYRKLDAGNYVHSLHYNSKVTLGNMEMQAYNGHCLMPGVDGNGKSYFADKPTTAAEMAKDYITPGGTPGVSENATKLGSPFRKFEDADLRKQQYQYKGEGKYTGMFLVGFQQGCVGDREYKNTEISLVDQLAYMKQHGMASFKEGIDYAEENSGIRLMKFSPVPTSADKSLWYNPDRPIIRLTEIHYMLAECKFRKGDKSGAAKIINDIRKRYFENNNDTNPVPADFDEYRLLDEWMIEFLGENRRRTDLIRWNKYTTEPWFAHEADGIDKAYYKRFPISIEAMGANNLLEQNPGYAK